MIRAAAGLVILVGVRCFGQMFVPFLPAKNGADMAFRHGAELLDAGKYRESKSYFQLAVGASIPDSLTGNSRGIGLNVRHVLAFLEGVEGEYGRSVKSLSDIAALRADPLWLACEVRVDLAAVLIWSGRPGDARRHLRYCQEAPLRRARQTSGYLLSWDLQAQSFLAEGRLKDAGAALHRADSLWAGQEPRDRASRILRGYHERVQSTHSLLVQRPEEALRRADAGLRWLRKDLREPNWHILLARLARAHALKALERRDEAMREFEGVAEAFSGVFGRDHPWAKLARDGSTN